MFFQLQLHVRDQKLEFLRHWYNLLFPVEKEPCLKENDCENCFTLDQIYTQSLSGKRGNKLKLLGHMGEKKALQSCQTNLIPDITKEQRENLKSVYFCKRNK